MVLGTVRSGREVMVCCRHRRNRSR
jgi:hypothetical protein